MPGVARLRIAYVINSLEGGGAAAPVPAIIEVLRGAGAEVRLLALTPRDRRVLPAIEAGGIDWRVRAGGRDDHWAAWRWLEREVADYAPDLLWTSLTRATLLGQLVGARRKLPVVSWQHAAWLKPANRWLLRAMQRRSLLWVADSASVAALTGERLRVEPERLITWPIFAADPAAPIAVPWRPGEAVRLGSLGRLHPVKGFDVLVKALAVLPGGPPIDVVIAGEGDERPRLETMTAASGFGNVRLAGFIDDPRQFLSGLHLYLQPSRSEGFCIAAHEAMQAGLPVVASSVGELALSITRDVGRIVPPNDPAALAAAISELISHPERLATMGAAARAKILDRYSRERFTAAGCAVLERAVALARRRQPQPLPAIDRSV